MAVMVEQETLAPICFFFSIPRSMSAISFPIRNAPQDEANDLLAPFCLIQWLFQKLLRESRQNETI